MDDVRFDFLLQNLDRMSQVQSALVIRCSSAAELEQKEINWLTNLHIWLHQDSGSISHRKLKGLNSAQQTGREFIPTFNRDPDHILIARDGIDLAIVHRNGMTNENALKACLRDGVFGEDHLSDQEIRAVVGRYETFPVDKTNRPKLNTFKAPKRKHGTMPTSANTIERIQKFIEILELRPKDYPIPALNKDAHNMAEELSKEYHRRKNSDELPATEAQMSYALHLAKEHGLELPDRQTKTTISDFIAQARLTPTLEQRADDAAEMMASEFSDEIDFDCCDTPGSVTDEELQALERIKALAPLRPINHKPTQVYSPYLDCIYDQLTPTSQLGRGTHFSIFRCLSVKNERLADITPPREHTFAVIWDEDHDCRVIEAIEKLYARGLLSPVLFVGERKGNLNLLLQDDTRRTLSRKRFKNYMDEVERVSEDISGDFWPAHTGFYRSISDIEDISIIHDEPREVLRYLNKIYKEWELGLKAM